MFPSPAFYLLDWVWGLAGVVVVVAVGPRGCSWWVRCEFCIVLRVTRGLGSKWILIRCYAHASERFMRAGKIRFVRKWARARWHGRGAPLCPYLWNVVDSRHAPLHLRIRGLFDGCGICIGCKLRWMGSHTTLIYFVVPGIFGAGCFSLGRCWFWSLAEGVWDGRKRGNVLGSALTSRLAWLSKSRFEVDRRRPQVHVGGPG
jgi:hypothetical protein